MQANMDEPGQGQSPVMAAGQIPYVTSPYQANQVMGNTATIPASQLTAASQAQLAQQQQLSYQQVHQQQMHQLQQQLQIFWANQYQEIAATNDFKNHSLPLALLRIKKIMKADEDVRMIAAEAPVLFARACEMFILELTHRSWAHTEENKRRTLQKNDIAGAIMRTDAFDFLADIVPSEELKEEALSSTPKEGGPSDSLPYYFVPPLVGSMGGMMVLPSLAHARVLLAEENLDESKRFFLRSGGGGGGGGGGVSVSHNGSDTDISIGGGGGVGVGTSHGGGASVGVGVGVGVGIDVGKGGVNVGIGVGGGGAASAKNGSVHVGGGGGVGVGISIGRGGVHVGVGRGGGGGGGSGGSGGGASGGGSGVGGSGGAVGRGEGYGNASGSNGSGGGGGDASAGGTSAGGSGGGGGGAGGQAYSIVPAIYVFGASQVDVGNNNYISTTIKVNFYPYGIDFPGSKATGRFSNGKNAADFIAEKLGLPSPKPYLSPSLKTNKTTDLRGINFASGGAGVLDSINKGRSIPFSKQISYFAKTVKTIKKNIGIQQAQKHLSKSIFMISIGNNDILGFTEVKVACCGQGFLNSTVFCNPTITYPCSNRTDHLFWDGIHNTEATAGVYMSIAFHGSSPFVYPINVKKLAAI
ncbi:hypothetical protein J5N97_011219 [Dioscorea zingiberensis]|uniref:Transcription factor CBF/NF-Y/archaeal histone domain-containing protein n=1 Tax=Dioscorea zingiberensis TaxID=325984 RepID=A0A9D5D1P1_9LILI|nr:hypothetical protein J5N97_011219 [Dioscorea zingiberensis]